IRREMSIDGAELLRVRGYNRSYLAGGELVQLDLLTQGGQDLAVRRKPYVRFREPIKGFAVNRQQDFARAQFPYNRRRKDGPSVLPTGNMNRREELSIG